ncbi:SCO3242 family prenyltransferase [Streptomyces sp. NBC_00079]|uniref:SCO3242 family prenyltransferase n=1 Tax=Streptomyces sp. NBC_00079 TaxID=2975644 RepID=UPI00386F9A19
MSPARRSAHPLNRGRAWAELLRLPALFTVPGDALAGAAAAGAAPNPRTLLAIGSSLCLYEAGMALNDWADREEDAAERPHRPLPSGRIHPTAALSTACALTGTGVFLAARAGRPALTVAVPLAATVWAYDLTLKHTPTGPVAMAAARALDLLLGAAATTGRTREALGSAALLGTHTLAVTVVSRQETRFGSPLAPLAALAATGALARLVARRTHRPPAGPREAATRGLPGTGADVLAAGTTRHRRIGRGIGRGPAEPDAAATSPHGSFGAQGAQGAQGAPGVRGAPGVHGAPGVRGVRGAPAVPCGTNALSEAATWRRFTAQGANRAHQTVLSQQAAATALRLALAAAYAATPARSYFHATLNPSPPLTQRAVTGGIRATIPLQAALTARSGAGATALLVAAFAPLGRRFARKVSVT